MSLYSVGDLVMILNPKDDTECIARILKIHQDHRLKEWNVTIQVKESVFTLIEDDIVRAVPLGEVQYLDTQCHRNDTFYVAEINGYPQRIINELTKTSSTKPLVLPSNHKDIELKHDFTSISTPISFDDTTYHQIFHSFTTWNPRNVLQFGAGDTRMTLNMFIDFKQFTKLKLIKIIEIDAVKFHRIEHLFDGLVRILKSNFKDTRFSQLFMIKKEYQKRGEVLPIKMTLKHKPSGRTIVFYRQILWNVMEKEMNGKNQNRKYQLISNWIEFTDDALDELFQDVLCQKMSRKQVAITSTQELSRNIKKELLIYQCGKIIAVHPAQTVYAYSRC